MEKDQIEAVNQFLNDMPQPQVIPILNENLTVNNINQLYSYLYYGRPYEPLNYLANLVYFESVNNIFIINNDISTTIT